jgi:NAD(P)-dependent dehydrogenase (short-subunit alcohol dehydrogenase family)
MGTVAVTGGASGLGAAVVRAVRKAGGKAVVLDRVEPSECDDFTQVDLSDTRAAERAVHEIADRNGGLDGVVTAAGTDRCGALSEIDGADWDRVVTVNLLGTAAVIRAALPYLLESQGRIVTVASTLGFSAVSDATAYCASKFGVVGFTRALTAELTGRVGVTLLVPGGMRTRFFDDREERYKPQSDARLNDPDDVAAAVVFALSQPGSCELRELVVTHAEEGSWPP